MANNVTSLNMPKLCRQVNLETQNNKNWVKPLLYSVGFLALAFISGQAANKLIPRLPLHFAPNIFVSRPDKASSFAKLVSLFSAISYGGALAAYSGFAHNILFADSVFANAIALKRGVKLQENLEHKSTFGSEEYLLAQNELLSKNKDFLQRAFQDVLPEYVLAKKTKPNAQNEKLEDESKDMQSINIPKNKGNNSFSLNDNNQLYKELGLHLSMN